MPDLNKQDDMQAEDSDVDSDVEWFAKDISDVVTLASPLPPSFPQSTSDPRARPDSILPPPRRTGRSRHSKPLPSVPRLSVQSTSSQLRPFPSAQLDPTFPQRRKSFLLPDRPPPPPPIQITRCSTATMERETEELLAQLASAALSSGFLGTGLSAVSDGLCMTPSAPPTPSSAFVVSLPNCSRPPPRMSVPADIFDLSDEAPHTPGATAELLVEILSENEVDIDNDLIQVWPSTPHSASIYSQTSMSAGSLPGSPTSAFSFEMDTSQIGVSMDADSELQPTPERTLRSRWSSSTLGSQMDREPASASWMTRFNLSPSKRGKGKSSPVPSSPPGRSSPPKSPLSPAKRSFELQRLERRDSSSSRLSDSRSDSGDSTASSGLRRKPIPVEMFIRA